MYSRITLRKRVVGDRQLVRRQAVRIERFWHQVIAADCQFLEFGVAGDLDDFHAVAQRRRNRIQHVRGRDEDYLGEVEWHFEVVIGER